MFSLGGGEGLRWLRSPNSTQAQMALTKLCDGFNANELKVCALHFHPQTHELMEMRRVFRDRDLVSKTHRASCGLSGREWGILWDRAEAEPKPGYPGPLSSLVSLS